MIGRLRESIAKLMVGSPGRWRAAQRKRFAQQAELKRAATRLPAYMAASSGGFQGGKLDRITEEWNPGTIGPNRAFQIDGRRMRERARELVDNNPDAKAAVDAYIANVIECGITPKPRFEDPELRKLWTDAWEKWGGLTAHATREADLTEKQTIYELCALWLTEIIVGGGCLVHYVERPMRGRSLPTALELIPEERFADDVLWSGPNPKTANPVINGVEVDEATGRDLAYWIHRTPPNDLHFPVRLEPTRLPAEQCEYSYFRRRVGANRGHTLLHAVIVWLWALGYYTDNELRASNAKSSWAYMMNTDPQFASDFTDLFDSNPESGTTDFYGNVIEKLEPGMIFRGAPGDKIEAVGPNVPGSDSMPWLELMQRSIAIGSGLSYEELRRDYSKGSFSSVRASGNSDRKRFRPMQKYTVWHFCNPTYRRFASAGARIGLDGFPRPSEFSANLDDWLAVDWRTPGWDSVKPSEDAQADDINLKNGTTTRSEVIAKRGGGGDWEAVDEQRQREMESEERRGLPPLAVEPVEVTPDQNNDE